MWRTALVISLLACYAGQAHRVAEVWSSDLGLWAQAVSVSPVSVHALVNYAQSLIDVGRYDDAQRALSRAEYAIRLPHVLEAERTLTMKIIKRDLIVLEYLRKTL